MAIVGGDPVTEFVLGSAAVSYSSKNECQPSCTFPLAIMSHNCHNTILR